MKLRVGIWAGVGLLVAIGWALYAYPTFLIEENPIAFNLALLTQPIALASVRLHFGIGLYWVLLANALTYGLIGLIVESVRQKLRHA